jgi:hypothetical protein
MISNKIIEKYIKEAKTKTIYRCMNSRRPCFWEGENPVFHKGETYCPVCGDNAYKISKK